MKVVIGTNVLVSGLLNPTGSPGRILDQLLNGDFEIAVDDRILAEYRRVLNYSKFSFLPQHVNALLGFISQVGIHTNCTPLSTLLPDPADQAFLEVARAVKADALVTGNLRHFPNIAEAITPSRFLVR